MTDLRRAALLLGIGTTVLLLSAGCAVPPPPLDGGPSTPSAAVDLANDGAEPLPVLPLGCADVLGIDAVQQTIPAPLEVWDDESTTPRGFTELAYRQAGGLRCVWGGDGGTDGVPDVGVQLWISPDAVDAFHTHATGFLYPDGDTLVTDTIADGSIVDCGSGEFPGLSCTADVLAGDWWIYLTASGEPGDPRSYDDALADVTALAQGVVDRVTSAGESRQFWSPPGDASDGAPLCTDPTVASLALAVDAGGILGDQYVPDLYTIGGFAQRAAGEKCTWTTGDAAVSIRTLQGGKWAFDRLAADGIGAGDVSQGEAQVVDTALDGALVACGDGCNAVLLMGGSLVVISEVGFEPDAAAQTVQQIAEVLAAGA